MLIEYIIIAIFGLLFGSFLNVCIYRIPRGESISFPPSHCQNCENNLRPWDLVPVFSYIFLRGRCRYCGEKISPRYPAVELLNLCLYILVYWEYGITVEGVAYSLLMSVLIVVSFIDYGNKIIPDGLNVAIGVLWLFYAGGTLALGGELDLVGAFLGLVIGGGFYLLIALITSGAMGGGDIKLMAALGLFLGARYTLLSLFLTFIIGGIVSLGLILLKKKGRKDEIPFGPFIAIASALSVLYGEAIIEIYIKMIT